MLFLVTGASAGFGQAICKKLISQNHQVIGCARRLDQLQTMQAKYGDAFYPLQLDIQSLGDMQEALASLPIALQKIDVLINNAGLALGLEKAYDAKLDDWLQMINTNIIGLSNLTRLVLPGMVERNQGLIINFGSIAGTYPYPGGNVYGATKAYVKQFSLNLRADLFGTKVRISNIEPGLCGGTEFSTVRFKGDQEKVDALYANVQAIEPKDIANIVAWIAQQPDHININSIEIMPVAQTFSALSVARN